MWWYTSRENPFSEEAWQDSSDNGRWWIALRFALLIVCLFFCPSQRRRSLPNPCLASSDQCRTGRRYTRGKRLLQIIPPAPSHSCQLSLVQVRLCFFSHSCFHDEKGILLCFCGEARRCLFSLGSDEHGSFQVLSLSVTTLFCIYTWGEKEKYCVSLCVCVFHCHAKDKRPFPVPSGAKPAGCRSCFCFVLCSAFSPRHTLLWRAFHLRSLPRTLCLCVCASVCVCLPWYWPWCGAKTRNTSGPIESKREN